jgi:hypothetical protein
MSEYLKLNPTPKFRRELSVDEIHYIWADPSSPQQQVALSSIVKAMYNKKCMAIARWVSKDGMDPKMGVLSPVSFDNVDCLIWSHVSVLITLSNETDLRRLRCLSQMTSGNILLRRSLTL